MTLDTYVWKGTVRTTPECTSSTRIVRGGTTREVQPVHELPAAATGAAGAVKRDPASASSAAMPPMAKRRMRSSPVPVGRTARATAARDVAGRPLGVVDGPVRAVPVWGGPHL